jgi:Family of unknown function (DUF6356)
MIARLFTAHPETVGESYTEHFSVATHFGVRMVLAGLACLVHAVLPFAFVTTGSQTIRQLHDRMVNRHRAPVAAGEVSRG